MKNISFEECPINLNVIFVGLQFCRVVSFWHPGEADVDVWTGVQLVDVL